MNEDTPLSPRESLALGVLNHLLLGTSSSVLHKALLDSKLGESVMGGGLSDELLQHTFSIGLKGLVDGNSSCNSSSGSCAKDADAVGAGGSGGCSVRDVNQKIMLLQDVVDRVLKTAHAEGFDASAVQASMNIIEFHMREFNTGERCR